MKLPRRSGVRLRVGSLLLAVLLLWGLSVTGGSDDLPEAVDALRQKGDFAAAVLRLGLGSGGDRAWSTGPAALVVSQSPLLLGGREAVARLHRETEAAEEQAEPEETPRRPIEELPVEPQSLPPSACLGAAG